MRFADAAGGKDVLRGEQPVVARQVHTPARRDRLVQKSGPEPAGGLGRYRSGEEHPHVGPDPGP